MDLKTLGAHRLNGLSLRGTAFIVAAAILPMTVVFSPSHMALFVVALAIALLPLHAPSLGLPTRYLTPTALFALGFLGWAAASTLWAIDPADAAARVGKLIALTTIAALCISAAIAVTKSDRPVLRWTLVVAIAFSGGLLTLDFSVGFALTNWAKALVGGSPLPANAALNRQGTLMAIWAWPVGIALIAAGRPRAAAAILAIALILCWLMTGLAAGIALAAGVAVAALSRYWRPEVGRIAVMTALALALLAPIALRDSAVIDSIAGALPARAYSIKHRLFIWSFTAERALERPVAGWGLASARRLPGSRRRVDEAFDFGDRAWATDSDRSVFARAHTLPLHPHNGFLQLMAELGLVGVLLAAGLVWCLTGAVEKLGARRAERACFDGFAVTVTMICAISYGIWQSWWLSALIAAVAFALACIRPRGGSDVEGGSDCEHKA